MCATAVTSSPTEVRTINSFSRFSSDDAPGRADEAPDCNVRVSLGPGIAGIVDRIAGEAAIIACEPAFAAGALPEAIALRRAGRHFAISVHVEDVRTRRTRERSAVICRRYASWDEVRLVLEGEMQTAGESRTTVADAECASLREAIRLSDAVVVRSWGEQRRLIDAIGRISREVQIVVNEDVAIRATEGLDRTDIVVYAPRFRADELATIISAFNDVTIPVTIVARDQPSIASNIRFEAPDAAADALGRARVIVDANGNDPGVSLALARLGRPLVVASDSGAGEVLRGVQTYDLWNRRTILGTTINALSGRAPEILHGRFDDRPTLRSQPAFAAEEPLVSVIVATYNRPHLLATTLATIEQQTYPNLEIIVVNDGGSDVRAIVQSSPRASLIEQTQNAGPAAARNRGLREARGTFVMFFDDDDEMFPDHVAVLARAIVRSGLDVAYGQMLNAFRKAAGNPHGPAFAGHTAILDHADIQWAGGALAPTAVMFRRSLLAVIGTLDESLATAEDYEFWIRLAKDREWARVSDVTSMYFINHDGTNRSAKDGVCGQLLAHRVIYGAHPSKRPLVQAGRTAMIEYFGGTAN